MSFKNEIENIHQYYDAWAAEHLLYPDDDGLYQDLSNQINYNKHYFSSLMETKQYVDGAIFEIIEGQQFLHIANIVFTQKLVSLIKENISDFSTIKFHQRHMVQI